MADITKDIRAALETKLNNISGLPDVAWENWNFDPKANESYVTPRLLPTRREPSHTGPNPQIYYRGLFVVDCYVPSGGQVGPSEADTLAETIINEFEATTDITTAKCNIHIRNAEREQGRTKGSHYMVPVLISWQTYQ